MRATADHFEFACAVWRLSELTASIAESHHLRNAIGRKSQANHAASPGEDDSVTYASWGRWFGNVWVATFVVSVTATGQRVDAGHRRISNVARAQACHRETKARFDIDQRACRYVQKECRSFSADYSAVFLVACAAMQELSPATIRSLAVSTKSKYLAQRYLNPAGCWPGSNEPTI